MSIDTTKQIKKVTYNGTEIPFAGGSSSSETATVNITTTYNEDMTIEFGTVVVIWETVEGLKCSDSYDIDSSFSLSGVLINSIVYLVYYGGSWNDYYTKPISISGMAEVSCPNIDTNNVPFPVCAFKVLNSSASIDIFFSRYS